MEGDSSRDGKKQRERERERIDIITRHVCKAVARIKDKQHYD